MSFDSNKFERDMGRQEKIFKVMFGLTATFILVVFVAIISFYVLLGTAAVKSVDAVEKDGLKAVLERVWCGKDTKCSL